MKGWGGARSAVMTLVLMTAAAVPASGQSSGIVERAERTVRRVMENVADAFDRGDHGASWSRSADDFEWTGRVPNGGSIDASIGERALGHDLEFTTVNGSVSLDVPDDLNAALDASWLNGRLDSDLPITLEGRTHRRSIRGTLGDGGATLKISTVNGSIEIR
jgi:Toastrack DUF4097